MKFLNAVIVGLVVLSGCSNQGSKQVNRDEFTFEDSVSLAIGQSMGNQLVKSEADNLDPAVISEGIRLIMEKDTDNQLDEMVASQLIRSYFQQKEAVEKEANLEKGRQFLEAYGQDDGIQKTESGILYKVLKEGTGESPGDGAKVTTHYTGKLIDGTIFDSSVQKGTPATFNINGVIPGWTEVLKMMKVGGKWEVVIPAELAYGSSRGPGQRLPPNSTLIFEIELLDFEPGTEE